MIFLEAKNLDKTDFSPYLNTWNRHDFLRFGDQMAPEFSIEISNDTDSHETGADTFERRAKSASLTVSNDTPIRCYVIKRPVIENLYPSDIIETLNLFANPNGMK